MTIHTYIRCYKCGNVTKETHLNRKWPFEKVICFAWACGTLTEQYLYGRSKIEVIGVFTPHPEAVPLRKWFSNKMHDGLPNEIFPKGR